MLEHNGRTLGMPGDENTLSGWTEEEIAIASKQHSEYRKKWLQQLIDEGAADNDEEALAWFRLIGLDFPIHGFLQENLFTDLSSSK